MEHGDKSTCIHCDQPIVLIVVEKHDVRSWVSLWENTDVCSARDPLAGSSAAHQPIEGPSNG